MIVNAFSCAGACGRIHDIFACSLLILIGIAWFVAAEIVYDGSLMEDAFLRSGMFAEYYVPLAAMYLLKAIKGERRGVAVAAWILAFLTLSAMMTVDILVTHYKPNSDHCCIPVGDDFAMSVFGALIISAIICVSDAIARRLVRKIEHPLVRLWVVRRTMRFAGTLLLAVAFILLAGGVFDAIGRVVRSAPC